MTTGKDKLELSEKIPLALALAAQSYVLFNWYLATVDGIGYYVDFVVAIAAGVALDLIVVTTTMGRREGRESKWSHAAAFGAFFCSALIALKVYGAATWLPEGWLHIAFPLEVWLYSQHLAAPRRERVAKEPQDSIVKETPVPPASPSLPALLPAIAKDAIVAKEPSIIPEPATVAIPTSATIASPVASSTPTLDELLQERGGASGYNSTKEAVDAYLDAHPHAKIAELLDAFPGKARGTLSGYLSNWQKARGVMATNGNGRG